MFINITAVANAKTTGLAQSDLLAAESRCNRSCTPSKPMHCKFLTENKFTCDVRMFLCVLIASVICTVNTAQAGCSLPHVLVIGDSISVPTIGYFTYAQKYLEGEAILTHNKGSALYSAYTLRNLDLYLSIKPFPVFITWNNGLHDISTQDLGHRRAEMPEYQNNLRAIAKKLLASGARVLFFTTTHVPVHAKYRSESDVIAYNYAARTLMDKLGIPVYYLGGFSVTLASYHLRNEQQDDVHYNEEGNKRLGDFVARAIRKELSRSGLACKRG